MQVKLPISPLAWVSLVAQPCAQAILTHCSVKTLLTGAQSLCPLPNTFFDTIPAHRAGNPVLLLSMPQGAVTYTAEAMPVGGPALFITKNRRAVL